MVVAGGVYLFILKGLAIFSISAQCRTFGKYQKQKEDNNNHDNSILPKNHC